MNLTYVAMRKFFTSKPNTNPEVVNHYVPGDIVADFMEWPEETQRIHLTQRYVKEQWIPDERCGDTDVEPPKRAKGRIS